MAKIVSMTAGTIDPIAVTKRVFFRPSTSGDVIRAGDNVCYNHDIVGDHKERSTDPTASHLGGGGTTYAPGAQTYTGRLFIVEKPASANLEFYAGVVKSLGPKAGADGDMIEIFVGNSGAVVPMMLDIETTKNVTIVGVRDGAYEGSYPSGDGRAIGIAMETIDRSTTDGLCWVKLDSTLFVRQGDYANRLVIDDEAGDDVTLNQLYVTSNQTLGNLVLLRMDGRITGAAAMNDGLLKIRAEIAGAMDTDNQCVGASIGLTILSDGTLGTGGSLGYCSAALHVGIGTGGTPGTPDMSGGPLACINATYYADETDGAPTYVTVLSIHSKASVPGPVFDGLFRIVNVGDISDAAQANSSTQTWGTDDIVIPIIRGNTTYYLYASAAAGAA